MELTHDEEASLLQGNKVTRVREIEQKEISTSEFIRPPSNLIRNFTRFYIEQGFENGAEAARKAGSQAKNPNHVAFQWLQDPWVMRELETARELIAQGKDPLSIISQDDVLNKLVNVYNLALAKDRFEPALKAVELMGKHLGMFMQGPTGSSSKTLTLKETQTLELTQDADRLGHLSQVLKDSTLREVPKTVELEANSVKDTEESTA